MVLNENNRGLFYRGKKTFVPLKVSLQNWLIIYFSGPPFQLSKVRVVLATVVFTVTIFFFLIKGHYLVTLWNITWVYFIAVLYSRNKIMNCLNSMYALLKITKYQQSIFIPLLLVFSSFLVYLLISTPLVFTVHELTIPNLSIQVMYILNFSLEITFNALCFSTAMVFRDIRLQMKDKAVGDVTKAGILRLVHTQWMAYQQVDLVSQAFSPHLFNYITVGMSVIMYVNIYLRKMIKHVSLYMPLLLGTWSMSLMCYCSHLIDTEVSLRHFLKYDTCRLRYPKYNSKVQDVSKELSNVGDYKLGDTVETRSGRRLQQNNRKHSYIIKSL